MKVYVKIKESQTPHFLKLTPIKDEEMTMKIAITCGKSNIVFTEARFFISSLF